MRHTTPLGRHSLATACDGPRRRALACALALGAAAPLAETTSPSTSPAALLITAQAASGIDIVRIPVKPQAPPASAAPAPPPVGPWTRPAGELGRFSKLPVKLGNLGSDPQKAWMGVKMEPLDPPLALALGLVDSNGAFILETTPGGPAAQGGLRFGDVIVGLDGRPLANVADLRQRVASSVPGTRLDLEVWRAASDGDVAGMLRRLAEAGNAYIMYRLGRMYAIGTGVGRDEREAVRWYRQGAAAGNPAAMTALAAAVLQGRSTDRNPEEGLGLLRAAIDKGSLEAMHAMGTIMRDGKILARNPQEAVRLFTQAAQGGHASAMVDLGLMYDHADGVAADHVKAAEWYRRAAELGSSAGMVDLGYLYARGQGVEQNDALAVDWYRRAVAEGSAAGMHNLAVMADGGRGISRDAEFAAGLILQALDQRYEFSYRQLKESSRNWSRDFRRALQRRLREAGLYAGPLDGAFGETTFSAIDAYVNRRR